MTLRCHTADLHVHTCLSPCAEPSMTPAAIVASAGAAGLDAVAICDHNSARNVPAARSAARGTGVRVIGGMEVTTSEEVHVLGLFDEGEGDGALCELQRIVYDHLPGTNDERAFGEQVVLDENGAVSDVETRLLIGATTLTIERVVDAIHALGGLAIASHVDREGFGVIGRLGFVPDGLPLDALELSPRAGAANERWVRLWSQSGLPLISSSDAHLPDEVGRVSTSFEVASASVVELRMALQGIEGRKIVGTT